MLNRAASAPPVIVNVAGLMPTVSTSVEVSATLNAAFSFTDCVAAVVITGALSLTSVTLTVTAWVLVRAPPSVAIKLMVLFGAVVSGSLAVAVYTTVLIGAFSTTLAVVPEVTVGASLTSVTLTVI